MGVGERVRLAAEAIRVLDPSVGEGQLPDSVEHGRLPQADRRRVSICPRFTKSGSSSPMRAHAWHSYVNKHRHSPLQDAALNTIHKVHD